MWKKPSQKGIMCRILPIHYSWRRQKICAEMRQMSAKRGSPSSPLVELTMPLHHGPLFGEEWICSAPLLAVGTCKYPNSDGRLFHRMDQNGAIHKDHRDKRDKFIKKNILTKFGIPQVIIINNDTKFTDIKYQELHIELGWNTIYVTF